MTTPNTHAAPWTLRRVLAMFTGQPTPRRRAAAPWIDHVLTGREATARHLFGEAVQWSALDMLEYDNSPYIRAGYLAEADRRISGDPQVSIPDLMVLRWCGFTVAAWNDLPEIVKADKREFYFDAKGL